MGKEGFLSRLFGSQKEAPELELNREERIDALLVEYKVPFVTAEDFVGSREDASYAFCLLQLHFCQKAIREWKEDEMIKVEVNKDFSIIMGGNALRGSYTKVGIEQVQKTALGYLSRKDELPPSLVERMGGDMKAAAFIVATFIKHYHMSQTTIANIIFPDEIADELTPVQQAFQDGCYYFISEELIS